MPVGKFHISMPAYLIEEVDRRGDQRSTTIARSLSRYFEILRRERINLRKTLSDQEISLVLDACNGVAFYDTVSIRLVGMNIADAIEIDHLDDKWEVDGPELIEKIESLSYCGRMALVDAVQTWWERVGRGEKPAFAEALAADRGSDMPIL